jgi:hypothetical protein
MTPPPPTSHDPVRRIQVPRPFGIPPSAPTAVARRRLQRLAGALAIGLSATLVACGGGGSDVAGIGTGGTGSFSVWPMGGFGSVIVNGVRYDDSSAGVLDDDGNRSSRDAPRLGMVVEVRGTVSGDRVTGTASEVVYAAEIKGPVTAADAAGGTLTVFGQVIRVTPRTVYDDIGGGLSGVAVGNVVEVYPLVDANRRLDATRIDGTVRDGSFVSVRLARTPAADGSYGALRVQARDRGYGSDFGEAEVEGLVSGFTDAAQPFRVNGFPVRLGTSVVFEDGVRGNLANGVRVEVDAVARSGTDGTTFLATEIERDNRPGRAGALRFVSRGRDGAPTASPQPVTRATSPASLTDSSRSVRSSGAASASHATMRAGSSGCSRSPRGTRLTSLSPESRIRPCMSVSTMPGWKL